MSRLLLFDDVNGYIDQMLLDAILPFFVFAIVYFLNVLVPTPGKWQNYPMMAKSFLFANSKDWNFVIKTRLPVVILIITFPLS